MPSNEQFAMTRSTKVMSLALQQNNLNAPLRKDLTYCTRKRPAFFRGHVNLVFAFGREELLLPEWSSTWVSMVSCHGMVTSDDGWMTPVTSKETTSPFLVQLTMVCKSLSISLRTASSMSHVLSSAKV